MRKGILIASAALLGMLTLGWTALGQEPAAPVGGEQGGTVRVLQWTGRGQDLGPGREVIVQREGERFRPEAGFAGREGEQRLAGRLLAALDNDRVKAYLNLTDSQADRLRQILVDAEKAGVKTRADIAVRGIELRELLRADKPDHDAVMKKVDELSNLRGQMMKERIEALLAAKNVLTPEQQKKIRTFMERRAGFGGGREPFSARREGFGPRRPEAMPRPPAAPAPPAHPGEPPVE